jgi:hypothetical protein
MEPIAGVDCYPGGGTFPSTLWKPGGIYRDRYRLPLAVGADAPTAGLLHAGLYTEDEGRRLTTRSPGGVVLELALLDRMAVRPREPVSDDVTYPTEARVGESITLLGYDLSAERVRPGGTLTVTLVWRAEAPLDTDYTAFVHLTDAVGNLVSQSDHPPLSGAYPTSLWMAGDVIRDPHRLDIDEDSTPSACNLSIGMYNATTGERLPAYERRPAERTRDVRLKDDVIVANGIHIR